MASAAVETVRPARRRRFRPTMVWLMSAVIVIAGWLGWIANSARTQRLAIQEIYRPLIGPDGTRKGGGVTRYAHHVAATFPAGNDPLSSANAIFNRAPIDPRTSGVMAWLRRDLGPDYFDEVAAVRVFAWDRAKLDAIGRFPGLRILVFSDTSRHHGDELLAVAERLNRLEQLNAWRGRYTDAGMAHLAHCPDLERLDLRFSVIEGSGLRHLRGLKRLRILDLDQCSVTGSGWSHLGDLTQVQWLDLIGSDFRGEDMVSLVGMTSLQDLYLCSLSVVDADLDHLTKLPSLKQVDLRGTQVSKDGVAKLRLAMPRLQVRFP